jgi:hypothetical protein
MSLDYTNKMSNKVMHLKKTRTGFLKIYYIEEGFWKNKIHSRNFFSGDYKPLNRYTKVTIQPGLARE